ncbi:hypothetical protein QFZ65_002445 [Arthrobacter sp. B3I9]|uniref:hypothetical protein n=1 Tax=Arthrobacter sp. B3I9 TaxID=3042270 RepID=UPI00278E6C78|nr:hypothetical protein [Arthrobacter sp. B3I9]MDQ0850507.1 hypothetical protein [Arthrobacter sp. B3I9]
MAHASSTAQEFLRIPDSELDDLFRRSPAGRIPVGDGEGTFIIAPASPVAAAAASLARRVAWQGKIFDSGTGTLRNKVGPLGTPAIAAKVYYGPSRFDANEAIILDYSGTSRVARWIRDEIREVAPGVFLGMVYWSNHRILKFALDFTHAKGDGPTPYQSAVTVRAPLRPGTSAEALQELARLQSAAPPITGIFDALQNVHFARVLVIPDGEDLSGRPIPASLVYAADVDGPARRHLHDLGTAGAEFTDSVFRHCEGFPQAPAAGARLAWLRRHQVRTGAYYVNTVGRGVQQVRGEAHLHEALEDILDQRRNELGVLPPAQIHRILRDEIRSRTDLAFALSRARSLPLLRRYSEKARLAAVLLLLIAFSPVLVIAVVGGLLAIRWREIRDWVATERPDPAAVRILRAQEDSPTANPFAAFGVIKAGRLRQASTIVAVWSLDAAARHVFNRGSLAGVTSIHFARWVFLDEHRRMAFLSIYDGSLESYMDDFIDKVAWGLNAVFSNGQGYPRTRFLLLDGARNEQAFKNYLRRHQLTVPLRYSAYPQLTAVNIENNARIRQGLTRELDDKEAQLWLARL